MNIKIIIEDDTLPYMGEVTLAGVNAARELSAATVICALADFACKAMDDINRQAALNLQGLDCVHPTEEELEVAVTNVKLRELKVKFDEQPITKPTDN